MAVRDSFGELTPANVVQSARADESPLHDRFEWDDSIAGEKYREVQASELIRSVRVNYVGAKGPGFVRGFLSIESSTGEGGRSYQPVEEVLADPIARDVALRAFAREWRQFKARYDHLAEFAEIVIRDLTAEAA